MRRKYNAISVFSGGGGLDLGAEVAGFTTKLCIDNDEASCDTLMLNRNRMVSRGTRVLGQANIRCVDIGDLKKAEEILALANLNKGEVDLIYGGPPCQAFSVFGRRKGMEDPRGPLLLEYVRVVRDLQPRVFVLENVPGLGTIGGGKVFDDLIELLKRKTDGGKYDVKPFTLEVCDYGVPQRRKRIVIVGSRTGLEITPPPSTYSDKESIMSFGSTLEYNTVGEALQGLPPANSGLLANHSTRDHSDAIKKRYAKLTFGERDGHTRINKLDPSKPSFTIIVGSENGGGKGHVHPYEPREVTPRESARIQTFPDSWEFVGTKRNVIRQVGNAVPPVFAAQLFAHILRESFGEEDVPNVGEVFEILGQGHLKHQRYESTNAPSPPRSASLAQIPSSQTQQAVIPSPAK